jgi:glycosyltransferase involved in cell wall biosynthesis
LKRPPPVIAEGFHSYQIGGSERVGFELALEFRRRGYQVICFALYGSEGPFREALAQQGIRCVDLNYMRRPRLTRRATFQAEVWRFLMREHVAGLHLHHANSLILCGLAARLARVRRTVMTEHAVFQFKESASYKRTARRYIRLADMVTVVSRDQLEYFRDELAVPAQRLRCVPNGVRILRPNAALRAAVRAEFAVAEDQFLFLYAGRLNEVKSLPTLLHAVAGWPQFMRAGATVLLVGDGPERQALDELTQALGIGDVVKFAGPRSDVDACMAAADAFVMCSRTEGLPMSLLEAMGASLPCLATAVGGIPELLRDGAGLLVPAGDATAMSAGMHRLMQDAELRKQLISAAGSRVAEEYSLDAVVTQYLELLALPPMWNG